MTHRLKHRLSMIFPTKRGSGYSNSEPGTHGDCLQRKRIVQWQREQQAGSRTQRFEMLAEEKKPALVKDREKRIAAKIEELRLLYKPKTWARTWARVFRDLGLSELPRY